MGPGLEAQRTAPTDKVGYMDIASEREKLAVMQEIRSFTIIPLDMVEKL